MGSNCSDREGKFFDAAKPEVIKERTQLIPDTFLVAELDHCIAGYIEGPVIQNALLQDRLFHKVSKNPKQGGYLAITSLSIASSFQKQGVGTALLAAMKDLVVAQKRQGIILTCHDYLIPYYEMNGFKNQGLSDSQHGGTIWYQMFWETPSRN
ncbi:acetyltransferase, GNAT family [Streptococcus ictaluri 707-05]|uniref:Acetyltransferase, GNAT family n=1 Tax=Streptococcus ictaluri 707-05 TaxID=764299 RepID=G5K1D3_9STRE|nr:acetyltransferase, GNAT family [Streptococcus ictaluri 707-05]